MAEEAEVARGVMKRVIQLIISGAVIAAAMFIPAGRVDWWEAWAFLGIYFGMIAVNAVFVLGKDPELIAERAETKEDTKGWDKVVTNLITIMTLLVLVIAGLDVRFAWSSMPLALLVGGILFVIAGSGLISWGMAANRFFARVVRIQKDRGQTVCTSGPYRLVRHPGYLGMVVYSLAMPFGLGSWWAILPALLVVAGFATRTALEDRTLQLELPGYAEYASRVRYRLVPGVW